MATNGESSHQIGIHKQGYAVFIVNIEKNGDGGDFDFEERKGAREDFNIQSSVFLPLGFKWINNTSHWNTSLPACRWDHRYKEGQLSELKDGKECCIRCHIQTLDHSSSKCFVLVISSHGRELSEKETEIIFSDGKSIKLTEILEALNDTNCPSLQGITRVIILQACRSNFEDTEIVERMQDHGVIVNEVASDQTASGSESAERVLGSESTQRDDPIVDYTFQQAALRNMPENFLLVYPAVSGQRSQRSEEQGSWMIKGMVQIFSTYDKKKPVNFLQFLTQVSGYIARERETIAYAHDELTGKIIRDKEGNKVRDEVKSGIKNAVVSYHRLLKPLIFYPKTEDVPLYQPFNPGKKSKKEKKDLDQLLKSLNVENPGKC